MKTILSIVFTITFISLNAQAWKSYVPYNKKGLWGYADTSGKILVKPFTRNELGFFNKYGKAEISDSIGNVGMINTKMDIQVPVKYKHVEDFNGRIYRVKDHYRKVYLINVFRKNLTPDGVEDALVFNSAKNVLILNDEVAKLYAYDPKLGTLVFKRKFEYVKAIKEGNGSYADGKFTPTFKLLYSSNRYEYVEIDINGNEIKDDFFDDMDMTIAEPSVSFERSQSDILKDLSKYYLDSVKYDSLSENTIIQSSVKSRTEGFKIVRINGKWGIITIDRKVIAAAIYDTIHSEHKYSKYYGNNKEIVTWIVRKDKKYGIVSTIKSAIIPAEYDHISRFSGNKLMLKKNGKYGVMDNIGNLLIPIEVDSFQYKYGSLSWHTCRSGILYMYSVKESKMAVYGTNGFRTEHIFTRFDNLYSEDRFYSDLVVVSGELRGLISCSGLFIPCKYKFISGNHNDANHNAYYYVKTASGITGYVSKNGRVFFEE